MVLLVLEINILFHSADVPTDILILIFLIVSAI